MGLDAFVRCNCYKEGKTKPLPFDGAVLHVDEDGYWDVRTEHENGVGEREIYKQYQLWLKDCCPHEDMEYCSERVGNWFGVSSFKMALEELGAPHFPVLLNGIPSNNGGCLEAELAKDALSELQYFRDRIGEYEGVFLIDAKSERELYPMSDYAGRALILSGKEKRSLLLTPHGVEIRDLEGEACYFSSSHYRQEQIGVTEEGKEIFCLTDPQTGAGYETCSLVLKERDGEERKPYEELRVIKRGLDMKDYEYITITLEKLLKASVETGNPVIWC